MDLQLYVNKHIDSLYVIRTHGEFPMQIRNPQYAIAYNTYSSEYNGKYFMRTYCEYDGSITNVKGLIYQLLENKSLFAIVHYANLQLFQFMLMNAEMAQSKTELVRLRIVVNMILSTPYLTHNMKILWSNWIKELYWERKKVLHKWYLDNILPF